MSALVDLVRAIRALDRPVDGLIAELAARQHGVVARWQLLELGLTGDAIAHRVRAGRLHRVRRGVYAVGHRKLTERGNFMSAVLACGPDALLSHRSNAALRGLLPDARAVIDVTVPGRTRKGVAGVRLHLPRALHPDDIDVHDGIPCTSVARMLLEVASTASRRQLERIAESAERERVLDLREVNALLERSYGHKGRRPLVALFEQFRDPPPNVRNEFEREVFDACDAAGIPRPQVNVTVEGNEVDLAWGRVLVELDSWTYHGTRAAFERDRARDVALRLKGYIPLRFTWRQATGDVGALIAAVRAAMELASAA
jgi:hypothetical protein